MNIQEVRIADIQINEPPRKDLGDLEAHAKCIESEGLLKPIGVTPDNRLIWGLRTLLACRDILDWETIHAHVIPVQSIAHGRFIEWAYSKELAPSEMVALIDAVRNFEHGGDLRWTPKTGLRWTPKTGPLAKVESLGSAVVQEGKFDGKETEATFGGVQGQGRVGRRARGQDHERIGQSICSASHHDWPVEETVDRERTDVFDPNRASRASGSGSTRETELYEQIGRLQMELAWLKKKSALFD